MRYLLLNACPRRGNTWKAVTLLKEALSALEPDAQFEEMQLSTLELPLCTGCSLCFRKGADFCPHRGVMDEIIAAIDRCDGLILSVTTCNMQPNALAKNLIDHLCYLLHRPRFFTKKALVVSTTGGVGAGKATKYAAGALEGMGFNRAYRLPIRALSWNDLQPGDSLRKKCARAAARFHTDVATGKLRAPKALLLIPYNLFRGMSRASAPGTPYATEDGIHWLAPERKTSVYDAAVPVRNPLKWLLGHMFFGIGLLGGKVMMVTYKKD